MSCYASILDLCFLIQETFKSPTFNFGTTDVSKDTFYYNVSSMYTNKVNESFEVDFIDDNTIYIKNIDLPISDYKHELIWVRNGISEVVFQGKLKVTDKSNECLTCNKTSFNVIVQEENIVVKVDFSERIIERITDKGPKGDPFTYDDFTAEQIAELQKPASDFVAENKPLIDTAIANAETATNNATTATTNAITVTNNANVATQNAIDATTNADTATANAIEATTNANTATANAITATNNANNAKGWSPYFIFENDGAQRIVKKLADWIGGTGTKPTQNVGQYVLENGYTTDKSLASNFKGEQSDNLLAKYQHVGNKEIYFSAIDFTTGLATTTVPHGLTPNASITNYQCFLFMNNISEFMNNNLDKLNYEKNYMSIPYEYLTKDLMFFSVIDSTTIKIHDSIGNVIPVNATSTLNNGNIDISRFHIEMPTEFNLTNLPKGLRKIKVEITGFCNQYFRYYIIHGYTSDGSVINNNIYSEQSNGFFCYINQINLNNTNNVSNNIFYSYEFILDLDSRTQRRSYFTSGRNATANTYNLDIGGTVFLNGGFTFRKEITSIASVGSEGGITSNGSVVKIYKM